MCWLTPSGGLTSSPLFVFLSFFLFFLSFLSFFSWFEYWFGSSSGKNPQESLRVLKPSKESRRISRIVWLTPKESPQESQNHPQDSFKNTQESQRIPKNPKESQRIPKNPKKNPGKSSRLFWESPRIWKNPQESLRIPENLPKRFDKIKNKNLFKNPKSIAEGL